MDTHIQIRWNSLRKLDNLGYNKNYNERHLLRFIYTLFSHIFETISFFTLIRQVRQQPKYHRGCQKQILFNSNHDLIMINLILNDTLK